MLGYIDPGNLYTVGGPLGAALAFVLSVAAVLWLALRRGGNWLRRRWRWVAGVGAGLVVVVAGAGVARHLRARGVVMSLPTAQTGRVIVLALDGVSPDLLEPRMDAGALPQFARLRALGAYRRLATTQPPQSPVAWAGFATGRNPAQHGLHDFLERLPGRYTPRIAITRLDGDTPVRPLRARAWWQYAAEAGVPVTVLGCPNTFPPDAVNGRMLAGMGVPDVLGTQGTFIYVTSDAAEARRVTGGEVLHVPAATPWRFALPGPQRQTWTGATERVTLPAEVVVAADSGRATIRLGDATCDLAPGQWSGWLSLRFRLGPLRQMAAITQAYLVSLTPELRLYVSPLSLDPREPWFPLSHPPEYAAELASQLGLFATRGMPFDTWGRDTGCLPEPAFRQQAEALQDERERLLDFELGRLTRGVLFAYCEYPDTMQHLYWRADGATPAPIEDCYRRLDRLVGRVLDRLGPRDTLLVLSDHGFASFRRAVHLNAWLREQGYLVLRDGATTSPELFAAVDWTRTRAYALGFGGVFLNLAGREPQGLVAVGDAAALRAELRARLAAWTDPATGEPIGHGVYLREELYAGPYLAEMPDVLFGCRRGYRVSWESALGAVPAALLADNDRPWSGDHLMDAALVPGVLLCNRPLPVATPTLYDLAPTLLHLMGLPAARVQAEQFDGQTWW